MATGIADYGDKDFSGTFSWDNNELHRKIFESMLLINSENDKIDTLTIITAGNLNNEEASR